MTDWDAGTGEATLGGLRNQLAVLGEERDDLRATLDRKSNLILELTTKLAAEALSELVTITQEQCDAAVARAERAEARLKPFLAFEGDPLGAFEMVVKERDAAVARAERAEETIAQNGYAFQNAMNSNIAKLEAAQAQVARLREALVVWVLNPASEFLAASKAARAVLEETKP